MTTINAVRQQIQELIAGLLLRHHISICLIIAILRYCQHRQVGWVRREINIMMALRENDGGNHTTINQLLFVEVQAGVDGAEHEPFLVLHLILD